MMLYCNYTIDRQDFQKCMLGYNVKKTELSKNTFINRKMKGNDLFYLKNAYHY